MFAGASHEQIGNRMADIALPTSTIPQLLVSIDDACAALGGISRVIVYELINKGELERVKIGRRSFITLQALSAYVDRLRASA
jgi:excisionase family DNA binding protein